MLREFGIESPAAPRPGVTLMEVMIAIGVMTVGLMGMASLIPLGRLELSEGDRMDNVSSLGRASFRDITVRGYLRPEMWVDPVTGRSVVPQAANTNEYSLFPAATTARQFTAAGGVIGPPYAPVVVDPLMIAPKFFQESVNAASLNADEMQHRTRCRTFPYSISLPGSSGSWPESTAPKIARVTLRTIPPEMATASAGGLSSTMRYDVASRFFRSNDDLNVRIPTDKIRRPVQEFALSAMTNLTITASTISFTAGATTATSGSSQDFEPVRSQVAYRKFRGDYSWFFVAEPSLAESYSPHVANMPIVGGPNASLLSTRQYRVWTVICHKRDLRETQNMDLSQARDVGERMAWVDFIDRNTVRLRIHDADRDTARKVLSLRSNQWFAAIGGYREPALGNQPRYIMEWYRVVNVAEDVQNIPETNTWFREMTVAGRDFSSLGFEFVDADEFSGYEDIEAVARGGGASSVEPLTAWGVLVQGVRGVFEKSVYIDRPSSWAMP